MKKYHANPNGYGGNGPGGARPGAGRPPKPDKHLWGRVSCILRHDTISRLRAGAGSQNIGTYLQEILDRHLPRPKQEVLALEPDPTVWTPRPAKPRSMSRKQLVSKLARLLKANGKLVPKKTAVL